MSRLAFKNAIRMATAGVPGAVIPASQLSSAGLLETLENLDATVQSLSPGDRVDHVGALYRRVITECKRDPTCIPKPLQDRLAGLHGSLTLDHAIMRDKDDLKGLLPDEVKAEVPEIVLLFDHSGSMDRPEAYTTADSVVDTLRARQATGANVRVYLFGDYRHELGRPLSLAEYKAGLDSRRYQFDGGYTEFNPAWDLSSRDPRSCVVVIVSDGAFNGAKFSAPALLFHPGVRAVIFYAPPWSPAGVTKQHAGAISTKIPQGAVYNGDILPGQIGELGNVLDRLVGTTIVPELPGRVRIGTISIPAKFLLPSFLGRVLNDCASGRVPLSQAGVFIARLCELYDQLTASARQDIERCLFGDLFTEIMSLNPGLIKFCENTIGEALGTGDAGAGDAGAGESKGDSKSSASSSKPDAKFIPLCAQLLKAVTGARDLISSEYPKLQAKYRGDPAKLAQLESAVQRATTVSERSEILEARGHPSAFLRFADAKSVDAVATLFHRMRTMFTGPGPAMGEIDYMLSTLFETATISPRPVAGAKVAGVAGVAGVADDEGFTLEVPLWRTKEGNVDLLTSLRLLPGYLRREQHRCGLPLSPDFTYQPRSAMRIACFLRVAEIQGAKFPAWLSESLREQVRLTDALTSDKDDDNLAPYWLHIVRQLMLAGTKGSGSEAECSVAIERIEARLKAIALKFWTQELKEHTLEYTKPLYPGVEPLILPDAKGQDQDQGDDKRDATPYVVFTDAEGNFMDTRTGKPYSKARVLTDPEEIARAYSANCGRSKHTGGYVIRPTYLTGGLVTLWNTCGPSKEQVLADQLEGRYSKLQIQAHLHTLRDRDAIQVLRWGEDTKEAVQRALTLCHGAPTLTETVQFTVTGPQIRSLLTAGGTPFVVGVLRGVSEFPKLDAKVREQWPSDVDYLVACGAGDVKLPTLPPVVFCEAPPVRDEVVAKLLTEYRESCVRALDRALLPPKLVGDCPYLDVVRAEVVGVDVALGLDA